MATLATGGSDCYYEFGQHIWDIAAGDLIVREAGGVTMVMHIYVSNKNIIFIIASVLTLISRIIIQDPAGGPLDLLSRRMLACSTVELARAYSSLLTQYNPEPRDCT